MPKRSLTVASASAVGFLGVIALHNSPASTVASPSHTTVSTSRATNSRTATPSTNAPSTVAPSTTAHATSAIGRKVNFGYGTLSVKVTADGRRINNVSVSSLQTLESYSLQIAQQVTPILRSEVIQAQSAQISAITGATYTSQAYAMSLQSALDKLHLP
ncbi:MAG: FMN-binding protein [Ferrimicrobium sp.]